jgi:hypothetical protein
LVPQWHGFVMPIFLRKLHKYASASPTMKLWGDSDKKDSVLSNKLMECIGRSCKIHHHIYGIFADVSLVTF